MVIGISISSRSSLCQVGILTDRRQNNNQEEGMRIRKQFFDFEYEEVLDVKTRELIRVACAVTVHCPD